MSRRSSATIREDSLGSRHQHHGADGPNIDSLTYVVDESDAARAHFAIEHLNHRGRFWNAGKHATLVRYCLIAAVGIAQATVAYLTNITSNYFIKSKYSGVYDLLQDGHVGRAYLRFLALQTLFAAIAALFVWIEPVAAGSGIPEVKVYLVRHVLICFEPCLFCPFRRLLNV